MAHVPHQQTPMSSKLTTMLLYLRNDNQNAISSAQTSDSEDASADHDRTRKHESYDVENEGIILGGDLCNCRKSKCLKLYCQCFNAARICNESCRCTQCSNTDTNENGRSEAVKIILDRNPAAFDSKFLSVLKAAHKSGCKCRKSMCLKKYCECFEASVPCGPTCVCIDCGNTSADVASFRSCAALSSGAATMPTKTSRQSKKGINNIKVQSQHDSAPQKEMAPVESAAVARYMKDSSSSSEVSETILGPLFTPSVVPTLCPERTSSPVASSASSGKRNLQDAESHKRPPLSRKKQCPDTLFNSIDVGCAILGNQASTPLPRDIVQPTMLSRVVAAKNCNKSRKGISKRGDDRLKADSIVTPDENTENGARLSSPSSQNDRMQGSSSMSPVPISQAMDSKPLGSCSRPVPSAPDFSRFVSPNTASVASALSLLNDCYPLRVQILRRLSHRSIYEHSSTALLAVAKQKQPGSNLPDLSQSRFPVIPEAGYDLIIIGSGPAGEAAAVRASQLGARVAVVEKKSTFGGPTGLTSKAIREAANRICKAIDQIGGDRKKQIKSLWKRSFPILKTEAEVLQAKETRDRLTSNGIDLFIGSVEFVSGAGLAGAEGDVTVRVCRPTECIEVSARHAAIASGSRPNRPDELRPGIPLPFLKGRVVTASEMALVALPTSIAIIGGGVIAVEFATVFAQLGVGVSLICSDEEFLPFLETEIRQSLKERMSREHILFVRESVKAIQVDNSSIGVVMNPPPRLPGRPDRVFPERRLKVDLLLYSGGRNANSEGLSLDAVHVNTTKYGRIVVDKAFHTTSAQSIFAIGDVIGPPGLASAAQQHGRSVSELLFRGDDEEEELAVEDEEEEFSDEKDDFFSSGSSSASLPIGLQHDAVDTLFGAFSGVQTMDAPLTLWTLPEIASVGLTIAQAIAKKSGTHPDKFIEGRAYFKDMARGRLSGDSQGYVKIIARIEARRHTIIGVHIIGEGANELIQLGSILVHSGASLESVSRTPFAAVTLSGIYQMACDDALLKSPLRKRK